MIIAENICFEVTRKCNLFCEHCLRGEAEQKKISIETVQTVLNCIESINCLIFTGGEPTLNIIGMIAIFEEIKKRSIPVNSFYIATNGLNNNNKDFIVFLLDLYLYCDYKEGCLVQVSNSFFHKDIEKDSLLNVLSFVTKQEKEQRYNEKDILSEGRGEEIGGYRNVTIDKYSYFIEDNNIIRLSDSTIYLNCDNTVINGCDWSYASQKNKKDIQIIKVKKHTTNKAIINAIKRKGVLECMD